MIPSFLPKPFAHPYEIAPEHAKSVVYLSSEFAIDPALKIYSGGLGFLAGSHMRAAYQTHQNLCGIGILWTYGYYHQARDENGHMAAQFEKNECPFLRDAFLRFQMRIFGEDVWVRVLYLPAETFGTVPMFFLTTDVEENTPSQQAISHRLYDQNAQTRIAQYTLLGAGGARLLEELRVKPDVVHLNEAHGLSALFRMYEQNPDLDDLKSRCVFTTHTPEDAGNERHPFCLLQQASFFGNLPEEKIREISGCHGDVFNHSLAALRLARKANGVSQLHGKVSRQMWQGHEGTPKIQYVTNSQDRKFWADPVLTRAHEEENPEDLRRRKKELKALLFAEVEAQTGKKFDPDALTLVWARRFAGYKRPALITRDPARFEAMLANQDTPVQIIWAGKPYPFDFDSIEIFNRLVDFTKPHRNAAVLAGYELQLSRLLKGGADLWLNTPVVTREASGTSGMTAAMNAAVNFSTYDGWIYEFAQHGRNSFIIPPTATGISPDERDQIDMLGFYDLLEEEVLPTYYKTPYKWDQIVEQSMADVTPFFDSQRMARDYYEKMYR